MKTMRWIGLLMVFCGGVAHAELSKWVDEKGEVHYSEKAPKHAAHVQQLNFKDSGGIAPADNLYGKKSTKEMEEDFQRGKNARDKADKKAEQDKTSADAKQARCASARANLAGMQQNRRMFKTDENGERVYMDDAQRQQQIDAMQQTVNQNCN